MPKCSRGLILWRIVGLCVFIGAAHLIAGESHARTAQAKLAPTASIRAEPVTVRLTPPRQELITNRLLPARFDNGQNSEGAYAAFCDRPVRTEGIRIELEELQDTNIRHNADQQAELVSKTILHCYGHGEYGISTFFGSVQHALELLMQTNPALHAPVRVIGAGCVGLTMALELKRRGFTQVIISAKGKYVIPSWRAGGFFVPGTGTESTPAAKLRAQIGMSTYLFFRAAQLGKNPYVTSDVASCLPVYSPVDEPCEVEILARYKLMPQAELVTLDFGNGVIHTGYKRQWSYFIDVVELMSQLWRAVECAGIPVVFEAISCFESCPESIICNCTGAGAFQLCADSALIPTRGHFLMLQVADNMFEPGMNYMINTHVEQDGKKELLYFFPKPGFVTSSTDTQNIVCAGMVGGTLVPSSECGADGVRDQAEYEKLAVRARQFFYGL